MTPHWVGSLLSPSTMFLRKCQQTAQMQAKAKLQLFSLCCKFNPTPYDFTKYENWPHSPLNAKKKAYDITKNQK